ncbi:hypothetical protein [Actinocorallia aurantiaca]|uniref:Uncharacterized protein n=1 Tax=Actinocorallia aurantiaca TaxID=46204 RepID=A0ABN3UJC9_9ACTN
MAQMDARLSALATAGQPITFASIELPLDVIKSEIAEVASGPFAALAAEAVIDAFRASANGDRESSGGNDRMAETDLADLSGSFAAGLAGQPSPMHLASTLEKLLTSSSVVQALAQPLFTGLLSTFSQRIHDEPILAAFQFEGAMRLAVSKAVAPYMLWVAIDQLPTDAPDDFTERLPRVLGVALDCWPDEGAISTTIRDKLQRLAANAASDTDALFELGCDDLRAALTASEMPTIVASLAKARERFATVAGAEEARPDAEAYAAVCDSVTAFAAGDFDRLHDATGRLEESFHAHAWRLIGLHQPTWLRPRRTAEAAWYQMILNLRAAGDAISPNAWVEPWSALDAVLVAYNASRTIHPIGGESELTGLAKLVQPSIHNAFLRKNALLETLRVLANHHEPPSGFDVHSTQILLRNLETQLSSQSTSRSSSRTPQGQDDTEDDESERTRVYRLAPMLLLRLGEETALSITRNLNDREIMALGGIVQDGDEARFIGADPVVNPLYEQIVDGLAQHSDFIGQVRHTFSALVFQTLLFLKSRADLNTTTLFGKGTKENPVFDYRRTWKEGQREPVEADLQMDFAGWLRSGPLQSAVIVEPIDLALGRGDVMTHFGSLRYLTEMKKDGDSADPGRIETSYLAQAAEYGNTSAPFGQLLVLDLTPKTKAGTLRLNELVWLTAHRPPAARIDRAVVVGIVTGNRLTPYQYSA